MQVGKTSPRCWQFRSWEMKLPKAKATRRVLQAGLHSETGFWENKKLMTPFPRRAGFNCERHLLQLNPSTQGASSIHISFRNLTRTGTALRNSRKLDEANSSSRATLCSYLTLVLANKVAQSVQFLATGWTTRRSKFDPRQRRKDFSSSLCVQTGSEAHPAFCTIWTGFLSPGLKRGLQRHAPVALYSWGKGHQQALYRRLAGTQTLEEKSFASAGDRGYMYTTLYINVLFIYS
jgi:hypothetical protein